MGQLPARRFVHGPAIAVLTLAGCLTSPGGGAGPVDGGPKRDGAIDDGGADDDANPADAAGPCSEIPGTVTDESSGHCYVRLTATTDGDHAEGACGAIEAHLVVLDQPTEVGFDAEAAFLIENLVPSGSINTQAAWIGLHREPAGWTWSTGVPLSATWDDWGATQPSGDGDCVELFRSTSGSCAVGCWNDIACPATPRRPLCEFDQ